jgi:hypothetical protein
MNGRFQASTDQVWKAGSEAAGTYVLLVPPVAVLQSMKLVVTKYCV